MTSLSSRPVAAYAELISLLRGTSPHRLATLIALIVLASVTEGFGIMLLVPLLGIVGDGNRAISLQWLWMPDIPVTLEIVLVGFVFLVAARALLLRRQQIEAAMLEQEVVRRLRQTAMRLMLEAEWRWLSTRRASEDSALLLTDIARVGWGLGQVVAMGRAVLSIAIYSIVGLFLSWPAMLAALVFGLVAHCLIRKPRRIAFQLGEALGSTTVQLHREIEETLAGAKLIKSLSLEPKRLMTLDGVLDRLESQQRAFVASSSSSRVALDIACAGLLALLVFVATAWQQHRLLELLPLVVVFGRLLPLAASLQQGTLLWMNAAPALARVTALIAAARANAEPSADGEPPLIKHGVRLEGVAFTYPGRENPALTGCSLTLAAGTTTAISGPSGAGKSTIADILAGLVVPDRGALLVDDIEVTGPLRASWRRAVAYIHQDTFFFDDTVAANLRIARADSTDMALSDVLALVGLDFVDHLPKGLETRIGTGGKHFSGGERQRLALARVLLAKPSVLILDEATSALDPDSEAVIARAVAHLAGTTTTVIISHWPLAGVVVDQQIVLGPGSINGIHNGAEA